MTRTGLLAVLMTLIAAPALLAQQQFKVTGRLIDASTQQPVPFASVRFDSAKNPVIADASGNFTVKLSAGVHRYEATRLGYATVTAEIEISGDQMLSVQLTPEPIVLRGITAYGNALAARRARSATTVRVFDREQLALTLTDVGNFLRSKGVQTVPCSQSLRRSLSTTQSCVVHRGRTIPVTLYVDEVKSPGAPIEDLYTGEFELVEFFSPAMVRAYTPSFMERVARGRSITSPVIQ